MSILGQESAVAEVVISDDASTDGTVELIQKLASEHPRGSIVRFAARDRAGGVARNFARAISECRHEFIALSDHDDVWLPHKITRLLDAIAGSTLAFSDAFVIDEDGARTGRTLFGSYAVTDEELGAIEGGDALRVLDRRNIVTGATVLVRRDFAQRTMPAGTSWVHDEWLAYLAAATDTVAVVREPLMEYRVHAANQIGVPDKSAPAAFVHGLRAGSARHKMHRNRTLALLRTLTALGAPEHALESAYSRLAFDNARLRFPAAPWGRYPHIAAQRRAGSYERFTSDPLTEAWRDGLQRP